MLTGSPSVTEIVDGVIVAEGGSAYYNNMCIHTCGISLYCISYHSVEGLWCSSTVRLLSTQNVKAPIHIRLSLYYHIMLKLHTKNASGIIKFY